MQTSTLLAVGLGFLLFTGIVKKRAADLLNYSIRNISVDVHGMTFYLTLNVLVSNPTSQGFLVRSLSGSLLINNNPIGTISSFQTTEIAPNSQSIYPVTIGVGLIGAGLDIYNLIMNNSAGIVASIKGAANIDGLAIPINIQDKIM